MTAVTAVVLAVAFAVLVTSAVVEHERRARASGEINRRWDDGERERDQQRDQQRERATSDCRR